MSSTNPIASAEVQPFSPDPRVFITPFFWRVCYVLLMVELLSLAVFFSPAARSVAFITICALVFIAALKHIRYGLYVALAELFMGGFGYLFWIEMAGFRLSLRLALFVLLFVAGVVHVIRRKKIVLLQWPGWPWYAAFLSVITGGVMLGVWHGHPLQDVFFDMNGYLYYGLLFMFFESVRSWQTIVHAITVWLAALLVSFGKVVAVLYLFTHQFDTFFVGLIYRWVRDTRVGEITDYSFFYRVFFQSHIYALVMFFFFFFIVALYFLAKKKPAKKILFVWLAFTAICWFIITLGYSRSFWIGLAAAMIVAFVLLWRLFHYTLLQLFSFALLQGGLALFSIVMIGIVVNLPGLPFTTSSDFSAFSFLEERTSDVSEERAAGSRFALLPPLFTLIKQQPFLGTGFGTTLSYQSQDPRALAQSNGGLYTTYSFEWAYLDTVTEVGVLGLLVSLIFLAVIIRQGWQVLAVHTVSSREGLMTIFALTGIMALMIVHIFTPYLNHPLGIGYSMFIAALFHYFINRKNYE